MPSELTAVVLAAAISVSGAVVTYLISRRSGLSELQARVALESDRLVMTLRERIELLERENASKDRRIKELETENNSLSVRLARLEKLLLDKAIAERLDGR